MSSSRRSSAWTATSCCSDRAKRRRQGLPPELRPAKLEDMSATQRNYIGVRLGDVGHHRHDRRRPDSDRAGQPRLRRDQRRPAYRALRQHRADPQLLLDPVGRLQSRSRDAQRHQAVGLLSPRPRLERAPRCSTRWGRRSIITGRNFGPYQFNYARIIEFPGYASFAQAFASTMPYSESIGFNANTDDPDKIDFTTYVVSARNGAPILGAPGDRRRHAGRHADQRDARAIFGADGDEAPLRAGQDPPVPEVRARQLSARAAPARRSRSCRSSASRTSPISTTARARW